MINNIKISFKLRTIIEYSTYSLLFLMLVSPFEYQSLKVALLLYIVLTVSTQAVILDNISIDGRVLFWCLILIITGTFFVFWGTLNGCSDSIKVFPVYVIWPIVYVFIIGSITHIKAINTIFILLTLTSSIIALYSIFFLLSKLGILPSYGVFSLIEGARISVETEFISYFMPSITSMLYLVPFIFSSLLLWNKDDDMPIKPVWLCISLILSLIAMILTGRRTFWILIFITPVITLTLISFLKSSQRNIRYKIFYNNTKKISLFILCIFAVPAFIYRADIMEVFFRSTTFLEAATFKDEGTVVRNEQLRYLLDGWSEVPLLGAGHGASLPTYLRSSATPWAYELSYPALLFQAGLFGFIIYFLEIVWIFYMGRKLARKNKIYALYIIPTIAGMTCFLVANATNPYLAAFDHLWTIFVPIILINVFLLNPRNVKPPHNKAE